MRKLQKIVPYVCSLLLVTFFNLLFSSSSNGSQLRPSSQGPKRLSELGQERITEILDIVHWSPKFAEFQSNLKRDDYLIQFQGENLFYCKRDKFSAISFPLESSSGLTSEERVNQGEIVPLVVTCILDEDAGKLVDYFLNRVSVPEKRTFHVEMKSDSLGFVLKYDIAPGPKIENYMLDASDFMGKNMGIIKLGMYAPEDNGGFYGMLSPHKSMGLVPHVSDAKGCDDFDTALFFVCVVLLCGVSEVLIAQLCAIFCVIVTIGCVLCIIAAAAFAGVCVWACYEMASH